MKNIISLLVLSILLMSCDRLTIMEDSSLPTPSSAESPLLEPTPTVSPLSSPPPLELGLAGIRGAILVPTNWTSRDIYVYASPFYSVKGEEQGFFVLEPSIHPHAKLNPSGEFWLMNIDAGDYVLVIGPTPDESVTIKESGVTKIFRMEQNKILDIGVISLK